MNSPLHLSARGYLRYGFSLLEMLAVMAVLATLVALIMPAVSHMRENGLSAKCASNLRQIGIAFAAYRGENNGSIPKVYDSVTTKYWFHFLQDSGALPDARILACPSVNSTNTVWGTTPASRVNYGMLDASIWHPNPPSAKRSQDYPRLWMRVGVLSDWPVVMDADKMAIYSLDNPVADASADSRFTARHNGLANVLMADGHIEKVAAGDKRWNQNILNDNTHLPR